ALTVGMGVGAGVGVARGVGAGAATGRGGASPGVTGPCGACVLPGGSWKSATAPAGARGMMRAGPASRASSRVRRKLGVGGLVIVPSMRPFCGCGLEAQGALNSA
ncbi:MAG: hypothetical protein H6R45_811, partial [Proteobacteria bacterium]|nr:hypothetical protein [Pseudomonadota bacterium]